MEIELKRRAKFHSQKQDRSIVMVRLQTTETNRFETIAPTVGAVAPRPAVTVTETSTSADAANQAFWILRIGFTVAPIVAGVDKFFNALTHWDQYLAPWAANMAGGGDPL